MYAHCPFPAPILLFLLKVATSYIRITLLKICSSFSENFRIMVGLIFSHSAREYLLSGHSELHDDTESFPKDCCLFYFSQQSVPVAHH